MFKSKKMGIFSWTEIWTERKSERKNNLPIHNFFLHVGTCVGTQYITEEGKKNYDCKGIIRTYCTYGFVAIEFFWYKFFRSENVLFQNYFGFFLIIFINYIYFFGPFLFMPPKILLKQINGSYPDTYHRVSVLVQTKSPDWFINTSSGIFFKKIEQLLVS